MTSLRKIHYEVGCDPALRGTDNYVWDPHHGLHELGSVAFCSLRTGVQTGSVRNG